MKEFEKLKYEIDLISKGEHNQEFTGVYQRLTELNQTLQLLQTDVSISLTDTYKLANNYTEEQFIQMMNHLK